MHLFETQRARASSNESPPTSKPIRPITSTISLTATTVSILDIDHGIDVMFPTPGTRLTMLCNGEETAELERPAHSWCRVAACGVDGGFGVGVGPNRRCQSRGHLRWSGPQYRRLIDAEYESFPPSTSGILGLLCGGATHMISCVCEKRDPAAADGHGCGAARMQACQATRPSILSREALKLRSLHAGNAASVAAETRATCPIRAPGVREQRDDVYPCRNHCMG